MKLLGLLLFCLVIAESLGDLKCYHCESAVVECEVEKASEIPCRSPLAQCSREVKIGASDTKKAIRKCVIPDPSTNQILCPTNYNCDFCKTDLCNSATLAKIAWPTVTGVIVAALYLI